MDKPISETTEIKNPETTENKSGTTEITNDEAAVALQTATEKITKLTKERDDFFKGMKKWKGIAKSNEEIEDNSDVDISQLVEEKVKEQLLGLKIKEAVDERNSIIERITKENAELKVALKNKPIQIQPGSNSNLDKPEIKTDFWTKEQLDYFKSKGIDPNKVAENLKKAPKT